MPVLTFYRHARRDGGIRTGLDIDGSRGLERFVEGDPELADDFDAVILRWYIDVIAEGEDLPSDPPRARDWFLGYEGPITSGLHRLSDELALGLDNVGLPLRWGGFQGVPERVSLELLISVADRADCRVIARYVRELADQWSDELRSLEPFAYAER